MLAQSMLLQDKEHWLSHARLNLTTNLEALKEAHCLTTVSEEQYY